MPDDGADSGPPSLATHTQELLAAQNAMARLSIQLRTHKRYPLESISREAQSPRRHAAQRLERLVDQTAPRLAVQQDPILPPPRSPAKWLGCGACFGKKCRAPCAACAAKEKAHDTDPKPMREAMPKVAEFIDACREAFGDGPSIGPSATAWPAAPILCQQKAATPSAARCARRQTPDSPPDQLQSPKETAP